MVDPIRLDRCRGCFLGLAIGDALGAPLEGLSHQQIRSHYGQVIDFVDGAIAWKRKPYRWRFPGLYSDDTQQALVLADVLLACGQIDPRRVADLYINLATPETPFLGAHRGVGRSFRLVVNELKRGVSPLETGQHSAGIGAAMRIAPVGLYFASAPSALIEAVMTASLMTHRDIRSLAGAVAVAFAVRNLIEGCERGERGPSFALWLAADVARAEDQIASSYGDRVVGLPRHRHSISSAIAKVEALVDIPRDRALNALVDEANCHGPEPECRRPTMGFPPACIPTCIYLFLTSDSLEEALVEVVNMGGDTDTAGAILGALAGAYYGTAAIPERWLNGLQNRRGIDARAEALALGSAEGLAIPELVETERRLSQRESERRERLLGQRQSEGDLGANRLV